MTTPPIPLHTYHCICTSLLLTTTHVLSSLPRRSATHDHPSPDSAIILPLPSAPPTRTSPEQALPSSGYTILTGLLPDRKPTLIRREDGFEKRVLHRCIRCKLVVGYELQPSAGPATTTRETTAMEIDGGDRSGGRGKETEEEYNGKILYLIPGGIMSTEFMMSGKKIGEEDVRIGGAGHVFEGVSIAG